MKTFSGICLYLFSCVCMAYNSPFAPLGIEREAAVAPFQKQRSMQQKKAAKSKKKKKYYYVVYATQVSADKKLANINRKWLKEGDRIGIARVVKIDPGRVVLRFPGNRLKVLKIITNKGIRTVR